MFKYRLRGYEIPLPELVREHVDESLATAGNLLAEQYIELLESGRKKTRSKTFHLRESEMVQIKKLSSKSQAAITGLSRLLLLEWLYQAIWNNLLPETFLDTNKGQSSGTELRSRRKGGQSYIGSILKNRHERYAWIMEQGFPGTHPSFSAKTLEEVLEGCQLCSALGEKVPSATWAKHRAQFSFFDLDEHRNELNSSARKYYEISNMREAFEIAFDNHMKYDQKIQVYSNVFSATRKEAQQELLQEEKKRRDKIRQEEGEEQEQRQKEEDWSRWREQ